MSETPVPQGLPEALPAGERILWRGRPDAIGLAFAAFRIGWVAAWFGALALWQAAEALVSGAGLLAALAATAVPLGLGALAIGLLGLIARAAARTTIYTVTDRRIVMRIGVALPLTLNVPFALIAGASVKPRSGGRGDIAFSLVPGERIGWAVLWPHTRAWRFARPEPTLRAVPGAEALAVRIGAALAQTVQVEAPVSVPAPVPAPAGLMAAE